MTFPTDYVIHEVTHGASARWAFVIKPYIKCYFFYLIDRSLDNALSSRLGACRALWSCIETAIWTLQPVGFIEVHYMEKNPGMFSSKSFISFQLKKERQGHLGLKDVCQVRINQSNQVITQIIKSKNYTFHYLSVFATESSRLYVIYLHKIGKYLHLQHCSRFWVSLGCTIYCMRLSCASCQ